MNSADVGTFIGLILAFVFQYFLIAWVLVKAYDDSRQHITDEIAEWNKRERQEKEYNDKHKEIEWLR